MRARLQWSRIPLDAEGVHAGISSVVLEGSFNGAASRWMRKENLRSKTIAANPLLQWSRIPLDAEGERAKFDRLRNVGLQWSRIPLDAEGG